MWLEGWWWLKSESWWRLLWGEGEPCRGTAVRGLSDRAVAFRRWG